MITPDYDMPVANDASSSSLACRIDYNWIGGTGPHPMPG